MLKDPKLTESRLDVIFKMEYAWAYKNNIASTHGWFYDLYKEHIRAINDFSELNNNKKKFSNFLDEFHLLINEFENNNWDSSKDKIESSSDGSIRNGAHRFALTKLYGYKFCEVIETQKKPLDFSLSFFKKRNLKKEFLLYGLEQYAKYSNDCHIIVLFPSSSHDYNKVELQIKKKFKIIYTQEINLTANGVHNLVLHMYRDHDWLSLEKNQGYYLTLSLAQERFVKGSPVKFLFVINSKLEDLHQFKKKIRADLSQGNFPIHVPDTHQEVFDLSGLVLRDNGITYLNNAKPKNNQKVHDLLKKLLNWIKNKKYDFNDFCVIGSAYVSLEGHREVNDLDILDLKFRDCPIKNINIIKKNSEWLKELSIEEMFYPNNNFFYNGIRILSRSLIINFKKKRAKGKDLQDLNYLKSNDNKSIFKQKINYFFGLSLESSFWILLRIRSAIPRPIKKNIREIINKFF